MSNRAANESGGKRRKPELSPRQGKALQALLQAGSQKEAAALAGITDRTMREYMANPAFIKAYRRAAQRGIDAATRKAQQGMTQAITVLQEIMTDPDESSSTRVAAASRCIEFGLKMTEFLDILQELQALQEGE